jgi:hypothetical protein
VSVVRVFVVPMVVVVVEVGLGGYRCFRGHGLDDSSLSCNGCRGVYIEWEMSWGQLPLL